NTFAEDRYEHDPIGRLTEVQEIPAGKYCKVRAYAYDEDSNRTSLQTREPTSEDTCATTGGKTESHSYDPADRLDDPGVSYETFSNITNLPAVDAGGEEMTASYYVDNQILTQKQDGETFTYNYDPAGRVNDSINETKGKLTDIDHYDAPGEAVAWISEPEGAWTRNVPGLDGSLAAIQKSTGTIELQLHDLRGDIVATASSKSSEEKLTSTYNSTEFGVPNPSESKQPPKYAWLGATGAASEITFSGTITDGGGSYIPQIARSLETFQVTPPGAYPNGSGPGAPYTTGLSAEQISLGNDLAAGAPAREAERQKALEEEAKRKLAEEDPKCALIIEVGKTESSTHREMGVRARLGLLQQRAVAPLHRARGVPDRGRPRNDRPGPGLRRRL
ncbi:MAG TPA: hypothetical protein VNV37_00920, partial [Solirubrobacteraceae bacterium]|nr:hypothetical protein [Solirubrobacteraceae bacterium]